MSSDAVERALQRAKDILDSISEIEGFLSGLEEGAFVADRKSVLAVTHLIMIIGEAAKHLAPGIEDRCPDIPWRDVRSMRDRIVHEYGTINPRLVWRIATNDLAPLRAALLKERDFLTSC
ncbi:HepT-like ribonuclease domain-containing protein [Paramagnetospirillum magneticum]|uniref:HepT-like ribonuclease domain-containing protein n=1 Tax=Paramagnetospirillum magneticum TaxID=84159 RepID=UPI000323E102|nr:HepT-like ribonuclease domain-containing protein [Paramagnetospirillum magneticum]